MDIDCTVYKTMDYIAKKWSLIIILELYKDNIKWKRYSELKRQIPKITPKILSTRLKELEQKELIKKRIDSSVIPIKSEYHLTEAGVDLIKIVKEIKKWAHKWEIDNKPCQKMDCLNCKL